MIVTPVSNVAGAGSNRYRIYSSRRLTMTRKTITAIIVALGSGGAYAGERADNALLCSRIDSEPCCYACPFSRMMAMRRSVTGSRVAAASSVMGFRWGVTSSVSSHTP